MTKFSLPKLEYSYDALEPFIDARTMEIHHTKHHQAYIDKLNAALEKYPDLQNKKVEELLANNLQIVPEEIKGVVRNHGGGHLNHSMFWKILGKEKFEGKVAELIIKEYGNYEEFKKKMSDAALGRFGSGWAWLVLNGKKLEICSTPNQDSPIIEGKIPLIGIDVWEHAYYLKYQNKRADYLDAIFNVINWKAVDELYLAAK